MHMWIPKASIGPRRILRTSMDPEDLYGSNGTLWIFKNNMRLRMDKSILLKNLNIPEIKSQPSRSTPGEKVYLEKCGQPGSILVLI